MSKNKSDYIAPIVLGILAYLASSMIKGMRAFVSKRRIIRNARQNAINLNHTIVDNFISDEHMLEKLQDEQLWEDCDRGEARWWDHKNDEPQNVWEEISKRIWQNRPEFETAVGFEYWCNVIQNNKNLPWHIDKDEAEMQRNNLLITPLMGAVYYGYDHHFEGSGELLLIDADVEDNPFEFDHERRDEIISLEPSFNRLIVFNASKWHKVAPITSGKRYTLAVNANSHKPKVMTKYG